MKINELIKINREISRLSQKDYGKSFGVSATAVSLWESGKREAPYRVIEVILSSLLENKKYRICPTCKGKGLVLIRGVV